MANKVKNPMSKAYKIGMDAFYSGKHRNEHMPAEWLKGWGDASEAHKSHPDMDFHLEVFL